MVPFFSKVGERAFKEMRTLIVVEGSRLRLARTAFWGSSATRLTATVAECSSRSSGLTPARKSGPTIIFGWETPEYYRRWSHDAGMASEMASASLELLAPQTKHSAELLNLFVDYVQPDAAYVARLKKHYAEVKRQSRKGDRGQPPRAGHPTKRNRTRRRTEGGT